MKKVEILQIFQQLHFLDSYSAIEWDIDVDDEEIELTVNFDGTEYSLWCLYSDDMLKLSTSAESYEEFSEAVFWRELFFNADANTKHYQKREGLAG